jgi:hypothetical protein
MKAASRTPPNISPGDQRQLLFPLPLPQRPFLGFARFIDIAPQHWLWPVSLAFQLRADIRQKLIHTNHTLDVFKILLNR